VGILRTVALLSTAAVAVIDGIETLKEGDEPDPRHCFHS
jgi:hypothetical protein